MNSFFDLAHPARTTNPPIEEAPAAALQGDMEVQVISSTTVHGAGSPAAASVVPLTIFDRFASNMHIGVLYAFSAPTPSNEAIKDGLVKTLLYYPTLTGRLGHDNLRRPCIHVGGCGGGALLVEAMVASDLADHVPFEPSPELLRLHPPTEGAEHVLQVQLNRFCCGGLVIGVTCNHRVADGQSISNFFVAWGRTVRGLAADPLPIYDYRQWLQPRRPPVCEFQQWGVEFQSPGQDMSNNYSAVTTPPDVKNVSNIYLHYSSEFIEKALKAQMSERYTSFESLLAHLWIKITVARGLAAEQVTQLNTAVNGRWRLRPPVPAEFFGNLSLYAGPGVRAKELVEGGVEKAARLIRDAVRRTGDEYFRSFVDFGAMHELEDLKPLYDEEGMVLFPNLEVDSLLRLRFGDLDFGGGGLCALSPTWVPAEGVVIFLPSLAADGGVDVVVTLFEEHAKLLRETSHLLTKDENSKE